MTDINDILLDRDTVLDFMLVQGMMERCDECDNVRMTERGAAVLLLLLASATAHMENEDGGMTPDSTMLSVCTGLLVQSFDIFRSAYDRLQVDG